MPGARCGAEGGPPADAWVIGRANARGGRERPAGHAGNRPVAHNAPRACPVRAGARSALAHGTPRPRARAHHRGKGRGGGDAAGEESAGAERDEDEEAVGVRARAAGARAHEARRVEQHRRADQPDARCPQRRAHVEPKQHGVTHLGNKAEEEVRRVAARPRGGRLDDERVHGELERPARRAHLRRREERRLGHLCAARGERRAARRGAACVRVRWRGVSARRVRGAAA